jgi:UDP-4-amino-4,6-dideoxy-N-acetyl-beta-L-altrosamine N-acetyltransferase
MREEIISELGILRSVKPDEIELILAWRNAPSVRANMYTRRVICLEEHLSWWCGVQGRTDQRYFMYEFKGTPQGVVAFKNIDTFNGNSEWAFYASPQAQKGSGSKMEFLALEYAFFELNLHKLCCEVFAFNNAVIKLHKKFGFKVEGIFREQHRHDEHFVDIYRLGILASEWQDWRNVMFAKLIAGVSK